MCAKVVLTADQGTFTEYSGISTLGYVACMPARLVPRILMDKIFTPRSQTGNQGEAVFAPYPLRKIEAALHFKGINDIIVAPPHELDKVIGPETEVLGISVHDPYGMSPVSTKLTMIFGGGNSWTAEFFSELSENVSSLKKKFGFKVFIGGPAAWQIDLKRPEWVDLVFNGEAEKDLPPLIRKCLDGEKLPEHFTGRNPSVNEIPVIIKPTRFGEVQVTRGCPRGCQFCTITPETFRSIPIDDIMAEVRLNLSKGQKNIELLTDDILLYGSRRLETNHDAVVNLFSSVKKEGADQIYFPHISSPAVLDSPKTVMAISEIAEYDKYRAEAPVVGLESGSERILKKYMNGKPFPWKPSDWKNVILESTPILNDAHITPCYTMTVGFEGETDDDVEKSIDLVRSIIDNGNRAWIFPLAVIPMTSSRLAGKSFPMLETLPSKYWELLYIAWSYDLKISREMLPEMTKRMGNSVSRHIVNMMNDRIFSKIDNVFRELAETHGKKSYDYSDINLNNVMGLIRSMYWLGRSAFSGF